MSIIKFIDKKKNKYDYIIVSVISPLKKTREVAFKKFTDKYFEVKTKCSLRELIRRDTKKLYLKARLNQIKNLIGYNSNIKYENTKHKKIIVNTEKETVKESVKKILKEIL